MLERTHLNVLNNGVRVVSAERPEAESVSIGIWIGVGGRHEPAARSGISHFVEHMAFKGTPRRSARALTLAIEGRGGHMNAFTQEDATCFHATLPHEEMRRGLDVLSDMVRHARFAPRDIERERRVVLEEIRMVHDQPVQQVQEMTMEALWPGHPLGRPLTGNERTLAALNRERLTDFRDRAYAPANLVFAFAGRLEHEVCMQAVERAVGGLPRGSRPRMQSADAAPARIPFDVRQRDIEQMHWIVSWRVFGRRDPRRYALRVLNAVLGENMSSRLFQSLRERHGLAYAVQTGYQLFADAGVFSIQVGLDPSRLGKAVALVGHEVRRLCAEPIPDAELQRAKTYLAGQFRLGIESTANRMMWLGETVLNEGRLHSVGDIVAAIRGVRPEEVLSVAQAVFDPAGKSVVALTPRMEAGMAGRMRDALE